MRTIEKNFKQQFPGRRNFVLSAVAAALGGVTLRTPSKAATVGPNVGQKDDTGSLQAMLNKGGRITLESGRKYRVSAQAGSRSALFIGSDTFLDLAGSTLELTPGQYCSLIAVTGSGRVKNVGIAGGVLIGNGTMLPSEFRSAIGITPTLYLSNCDSLQLRDLVIRDAYMYAAYCSGDDGVVDNIKVNGSVGGGIHLTGAGWRVDRVQVRNITFFEIVNCQGNPFTVSLRDSTVGSVHCENYGFGVKFQDGCKNVTVDSIVAIGGPNNYVNPDFLVKIQGIRDSPVQHMNQDIRIRSIVAKNGPRSGLYIFYSDRVNIASYKGQSNGRSRPTDAKNGADVLIIAAERVSFGQLHVKDFIQFGLWIHEGTGMVTAESVELEGGEGGDVAPIILRGGQTAFGKTLLQRAKKT